MDEKIIFYHIRSQVVILAVPTVGGRSFASPRRDCICSYGHVWLPGLYSWTWLALASMRTCDEHVWLGGYLLTWSQEVTFRLFGYLF